MIFGLSTDDRTLQIFASEAEAIAYAEGIDVEDGVWKFFDERGSPLEAVFTVPNQRGRFTVVSGTYHLRPAAEGIALSDRLHEVAGVEGTAPLNTIAAVKEWLTSNTTFQPTPTGAAKLRR